MGYRKIILDYADDNNGIVTSNWCVKEGIPTVYLSRMVKDGELHRVERGIYSLSEYDYDDFNIFHLKNKAAIFSYSSSLYLLGRTDFVPHLIEVSVYTGYNAAHFPDDVIVHYVTKELLDLGKIFVETPLGNSVECYDMERTVCDLICNRNKVDAELFAKTLQSCVKENDLNLNKLFSYAKKMKCLKKVQEIMEVLL
ncbi:type IV toxin-antitoxin system AbiEi family antitoxin domain-containing protein [Acidaminobacter hydrogenoformans]|uniref:Transcriptional regulator, AbiEi antitoxin, Type IV TA system n=1 Tax=Acidaminobacter hydrogenoformans DSM 2784 TaxID=1120920 RepID=A0A1G5S274_9FIRM|nr:type IV toxin-antitoxin system AbiEi family antitoxin domain-containing protein [Acidaminobacter hydrogenoformans]SCZ80237.1 Transcriptional regulator, AbiEi antitoxin, Type IV TA system [Acidaminobacter hydrogenoformans DSM 2784]